MFKFATPLFLILLAGALFFMYVDPTYQTIGVLRKDMGQYNEALNKSKELRGVRDQLLSKFNTFSLDDINNLEKLLPDNVDNIRLIIEIDNMASKYGVVVRKVNINSSPVNSNQASLGLNVSDYDSMVLDFIIEASYSDFVKFLDNLTNSLRIVDVVSLSFQSSVSDFYKYNLSVKTYWLK